MSSELLLRGGISFGSLLAVGGVGIAVTEMIRRRPVLSSVLTQRWMIWLILGSMWLAAAAWPAWNVVLLSAFAVISVREYARLRPSLVAVDRAVMGVWASVAVFLLAFSPADPAEIVAVLIVSSIVFPLLSQDVRNGGRRIGDQIMGYMLVVLPMMLFHEIAVEWGGATFFAIGLAVALSDVTAFAAGSSLGRRPLARQLSPNKTVAGFSGNLIGATLGFVVAISAGLIPWSAIWLAIAIAIAAVAGDLLVSLLKRNRGVKDAGSWLPGFGGLLDRVDSLLLVGPVAYVALNMTGGM